MAVGVLVVVVIVVVIIVVMLAVVDMVVIVVAVVVFAGVVVVVERGQLALGDKGLVSWRRSTRDKSHLSAIQGE